MILTINNDSTRKWVNGDSKLLEDFDDYLLYDECGWSCFALYKNGYRILHVHFNSREERLSTLQGCGFNLSGSYLYKMTESQIRKLRRDWKEDYVKSYSRKK